MNATKLTIEGTGNLVLLAATNKVVWQTFDTPTHALSPNQTFAANFGYSIVAWGKRRRLESWKLLTRVEIELPHNILAGSAQFADTKAWLLELDVILSRYPHI